MRKRRGLTQRDVAQAMGVTIGRASQIENGELSGLTPALRALLGDAATQAGRTKPMSATPIR
ncbi:MAG: helix-turn-helix transcriptional regulator [Actinomycetota bacterium]|nr:helix-turn-helix transcriptional regulator [Actinomycetota bacterium]